MKTKIPNISAKLAEQGILVHNLSNHLSSEYLRVTIGSKNENDTFLEVLRRLYSKSVE